jgi:hypothetical protein
MTRTRGTGASTIDVVVKGAGGAVGGFATGTASCAAADGGVSRAAASAAQPTARDVVRPL